MNIAILHHDLEWAEQELQKRLLDAGVGVKMYDIRIHSHHDIAEPVVLNRVYASVANRDFAILEKTVVTLFALEKKGASCINSYQATLADYSKYQQYALMRQQGIQTPNTMLLFNPEDVCLFLDENPFPLIYKRDTGGRAKDLHKVVSYQQLEKLCDATAVSTDQYDGEYILQEYVESNRDHDARIGIINGELSFAYGRTLLDTNGQGKWLASVSQGSNIIDYAPSQEELYLAIRATKAMGADINVVDMLFTKKGPYIIENNLTPNFTQSDPKTMVNMDHFVKSIVKRYAK